MSEQGEDMYVKIFTIERMTIELFQFWLDFDLPSILGGIHLLQPPTKTHTKEREPFLRSLRILWKSDRDSEINHLTNIVWAQKHTDTVRLEFTNDGQLANDLTLWLRIRFGIAEQKEAGPNKPPSLIKEMAPKLTSTEEKVASYLAEKLSYEQIAVRLGGKSQAAAKKHAQHLARKWNTRQIVEVLWDEAIKRGYGTPQ